MPGQNRETLVNQSLVIGYMDTGAIERNIDQLPSIQWTRLFVQNPDFASSQPNVAIPLREDPFKILMFGGASTNSFMLDTRKDVNLQAGTARVTPCIANLTQNARFASKCDMVKATFGEEHYAIDGHYKVLHVFNEKE